MYFSFSLILIIHVWDGLVKIPYYSLHLGCGSMPTGEYSTLHQRLPRRETNLCSIACTLVSSSLLRPPRYQPSICYRLPCPTDQSACRYSIRRDLDVIHLQGRSYYQGLLPKRRVMDVQSGNTGVGVRALRPVSLHDVGG